MLSGRNLQNSLLAVIVIASASYAAIYASHIASAPVADAFVAPASGPILLTIPKIGVHAVIEHLGKTASGAMAVPAGPDDVAWYDLGPQPGAIGSAVIAGHYGWKNGRAAVFDDLRLLKPGDEISVQDSGGKTVSFKVVRSAIYASDADTAALFDPLQNGAHLNLITCGGAWDKESKDYSERLVVFADKLE